MSPIIGLSEQRRLPRLGKIRLGSKNERGLPQKSDHFICPPEVQAVFGEKPTALDILIPLEDEEQWASQYYRCYSNVRGLLCRGDGHKCFRMVAKGLTQIADRETKEVEGRELDCPGRDCPYYQAKRCKEVMFLQFLLPDVPGLGIWQIDTGSINSIRNINSCAAMIRGLYGRVEMIPLRLTLEMIEVNNPTDGKKQKVWVLNLRSNRTLVEIMQASSKLRHQLTGANLALPVGDDELPEDLITDDDDMITPASPEQVAADMNDLGYDSPKPASPSPSTGGASTTPAARPVPAGGQPGDYRQARGVAPRPAAAPLPEETIRRARDGATLADSSAARPKPAGATLAEASAASEQGGGAEQPGAPESHPAASPGMFAQWPKDAPLAALHVARTILTPARLEVSRFLDFASDRTGRILTRNADFASFEEMERLAREYVAAQQEG